MQKLFALLLAVCLWVGFAPPASADVSGLSPCAKTPAFRERLERTVQGFQARQKQYSPGSVSANNLQASIDKARRRAEHYGGFLCGPEGYPRLIVDGRLSHAGEFLIPSVLFLYLAGWLGWAGRSYIRTIKKADNTEYKEIQIDVPLAIQSFVGALFWPLAALKEIASGEIQEDDKRIPVSPR
jgi:photosystem I subunit III